MYQTEVSVRQNDIMKVLTIVTTIFLPLSLLTSWYGMNFKYMPELGTKYGYYVIILVSIIIVVISVAIFKKKKIFLKATDKTVAFLLSLLYNIKITIK